jgi:ADP-ribose pyrophosphatase YjhB (NUDIX family)
MTSVYQCDSGCCNYKIVEYKTPNYNDNEEWKNREISGKIKKGGAFIYDPKRDKVLLVQSRGQFWGPPKGTLQNNETIKEGSIREVKEETGIQLEEKDLDKYYIVKGKAIYYFVELEEDEVEVQEEMKDNDANGIGWFNVRCLYDLIKQQKIMINRHTKILLDKFLGLEIY